LMKTCGRFDKNWYKLKGNSIETW